MYVSITITNINQTRERKRIVFLCRHVHFFPETDADGLAGVVLDDACNKGSVGGEVVIVDEDGS